MIPLSLDALMPLHCVVDVAIRDAWNALGAMAQEDAMDAYVEELKKVLGENRPDPTVGTFICRIPSTWSAFYYKLWVPSLFASLCITRWNREGNGWPLGVKSIDMTQPCSGTHISLKAIACHHTPPPSQEGKEKFEHHIMLMYPNNNNCKLYVTCIWPSARGKWHDLSQILIDLRSQKPKIQHFRSGFYSA